MSTSENVELHDSDDATLAQSVSMSGEDDVDESENGSATPVASAAVIASDIGEHVSLFRAPLSSARTPIKTRRLNVTGGALRSLDRLERFVDTDEFIAPHNAISTLNVLGKLAPKLATLDLSHNLVENAKALVRFSSLRRVDLSHNRIESLPTLELPSLETIVLSHNRLTELPQVSGCLSLKSLVLANNCIAALESVALRLPPTIVRLDLSENQIARASELFRFKSLRLHLSLEDLNLAGNPVAEILGSAKCRTLTLASLCTRATRLQLLDGEPIQDVELIRAEDLYLNGQLLKRFDPDNDNNPTTNDADILEFLEKHALDRNISRVMEHQQQLLNSGSSSTTTPQIQPDSAASLSINSPMANWEAQLPRQIRIVSAPQIGRSKHTQQRPRWRGEAQSEAVTPINSRVSQRRPIATAPVLLPKSSKIPLRTITSPTSTKIPFRTPLSAVNIENRCDSGAQQQSAISDLARITVEQADVLASLVDKIESLERRIVDTECENVDLREAIHRLDRDNHELRERLQQAPASTRKSQPPKPVALDVNVQGNGDATVRWELELVREYQIWVDGRQCGLAKAPNRAVAVTDLQPGEHELRLVSVSLDGVQTASSDSVRFHISTTNT